MDLPLFPAVRQGRYAGAVVMALAMSLAASATGQVTDQANASTDQKQDAKPQPVAQPTAVQAQRPVHLEPGAPVLNPQTTPPVRQLPNPQATAQPGHGAAQPGIPAPTVVLKPGEVPKIEFDNPNYNIGRIPAGGEIIHDFWFTNTGTGPLEIVMFKPS